VRRFESSRGHYNRPAESASGGGDPTLINYVDTRAQLTEPLSFTEVVLRGIAPGGGLFVPERVPSLDWSDFEALAGLPYWRRVGRLFDRFEPDIISQRVAAIAKKAYGSNFRHKDVAVVRELGAGRFVLELWHGPTLAFKDMALQCMPLFFSEAVEQARGKGRDNTEYLVLVATSGDTGVAALNGFADRSYTRIAVCYPDGGVSSMQRLQMVTQPGDNLTVFAVKGDFDACQRCVKDVFNDDGFGEELLARHGLRLSSANSINWGRLLPQIVYYISAYADMAERGHVATGEPIDVCVPSGNFGNLLAAYYAKRVGTPIDRLLCASNANNVLADFLSTGRYEVAARQLVKTASPSMDILVSSNLERLLYELTGNGPQVRTWMQDLSQTGAFALDEVTFARLRRDFVGDWVDNETSVATIGQVYRERKYLMDPHTAVAWQVADRHAGQAPMLVVSPAHWSKFPADVIRGLRGEEPGTPLPEDEQELLACVERLAPGQPVPPVIRDICRRPVRFKRRIDGDRQALEQGIRDWLESA
jgi:threonine synthase